MLNVDPGLWALRGGASVGAPGAVWRGLQTRLATLPDAAAELGTVAIPMRAGEALRIGFVVAAGGALGSALQARVAVRRGAVASSATLTFATRTVAIAEDAGDIRAERLTELSQGRWRLEFTFEAGATGDVVVAVGSGEAAARTLTIHAGAVTLDARPRSAAEIAAEDPPPSHVIYVDAAATGVGTRIAVADPRGRAELLAAWALARQPANAFPSLTAAWPHIAAGTAVAVKGGASAAAPLDYTGATGVRDAWQLTAAQAGGAAPVWLVCDGPPGSARLLGEAIDAASSADIRRVLMLNGARRVRVCNLGIVPRVRYPWLGGDSTGLYAFGSEGQSTHRDGGFAAIGRDDIRLTGLRFATAPGRGALDLLKLNKLDGALVAGCGFAGGTTTLVDQGETRTTCLVIQEAFDNVTVFNLEVANCDFDGSFVSPFNFKDASLNLWFHHNALSVQAYRSKSRGASPGQWQAALGYPRVGGTGWSGDGVPGEKGASETGRDAPRYPGVTEHQGALWMEAANALITDNDIEVVRADTDSPTQTDRQYACLDLRSARGVVVRRNRFRGADRRIAILIDSERTGWSRDQITRVSPAGAAWEDLAYVVAAAPPAPYDAALAGYGDTGGQPAQAPWRLWRTHQVLLGAGADANHRATNIPIGVGQRAADDGNGPVPMQAGDVTGAVIASDAAPAWAGGVAPGLGGWDADAIRVFLGLA